MRAGIIAAARDRARVTENASNAKAVRREDAISGSADRRALDGMAKSVGRHVHRGGCEGGCKRRCATNSTSGKYRRLVDADDALSKAEARGWIARVGDLFTPGPETP